MYRALYDIFPKKTQVCIYDKFVVNKNKAYNMVSNS